VKPSSLSNWVTTILGPSWMNEWTNSMVFSP
jgi:hypothetical protein